MPPTKNPIPRSAHCDRLASCSCEEPDTGGYLGGQMVQHHSGFCSGSGSISARRAGISCPAPSRRRCTAASGGFDTVPPSTGRSCRGASSPAATARNWGCAVGSFRRNLTGGVAAASSEAAARMATHSTVVGSAGSPGRSTGLIWSCVGLMQRISGVEACCEAAAHTVRHW